VVVHFDACQPDCRLSPRIAPRLPAALCPSPNRPYRIQQSWRLCFCVPYCATNLDVLLCANLVFNVGVVGPCSPRVFKPTFLQLLHSWDIQQDYAVGKKQLVSGIYPTYEFPQSSGPKNKTNGHTALRVLRAHLHLYPDKDLRDATTQRRFKIATGQSTQHLCKALSSGGAEKED